MVSVASYIHTFNIIMFHRLYKKKDCPSSLTEHDTLGHQIYHLICHKMIE